MGKGILEQIKNAEVTGVNSSLTLESLQGLIANLSDYKGKSGGVVWLTTIASLKQFIRSVGGYAEFKQSKWELHTTLEGLQLIERYERIYR